MQRLILDNGLRLVLKRTSHNDIVAVRILRKMGVRYEKAELAGVSNLALRLLMKGTQTRTGQEIFQDLESNGIQLDSGAEKDFGALTLKCTNVVLERALEILQNVLQTPVFPPEKFETELEQVVMEVLADDDSPLSFTFRKAQKLLYQDHPYATPHKGTPESLRALQRETTASFYFDHDVPRESVLAAVGNFDPEQFIARVSERFGSVCLEDKATVECDDSSLLAELPETPRQVVHERQTEAESLVLGFFAPRVHSKESFAMRVLDCVLGGSMDSRLFNEVRDKRGLAYSVGSTYSTLRGPGAFVIYLLTEPGNHQNALSQCLSEVEKLQNDKVPVDELERAKEYIKGTYVMAQETGMGQADMLATSEFLELGPDFVKEYPARVDAVSSDQIQRLAQKYLNRYVVAITRPRLEAG